MQPTVPRPPPSAATMLSTLQALPAAEILRPRFLKRSCWPMEWARLPAWRTSTRAGRVATGVSASGSYRVVSGRGTDVIGGIPVVLYPAGSSTVYVMSTDGSTLAGLLEAQQ